MRIIKRLLSFLTAKVFFITLTLAIFVMAFYTAMNTANIAVLIDEGLEARAAAVIQGTEENKLNRYFTDDFLSRDPVLLTGLSNASPYRDYTVRSFSHKVQFLSIWAWPWESVARAEAVETVSSIDGTILSSKREAALQAGGEDRLVPPAWETCKYRVTLIRNNGRWKISGLNTIQ